MILKDIKMIRTIERSIFNGDVLGETDPELDELRDYFSNVYSNNRLHKFALKVKNELVLKNAEALLDGRAMVLMAFRNGVFPMKD